MLFNGRQWISVDGKWIWDGAQWTAAPPFFTVPPLPKASIESWIYRVVLAIQGSGIGCAGVMLLMIEFLATLGGAFGWALALTCTAALVLTIAAAFGLVALKQQIRPNVWRIVLVAIEMVLFFGGFPLLNWSIYASDHAGTPQNPGTDGPFADGWYGWGALTAWAFIGGAAIVAAVLAWELIAGPARWIRSRWASDG